MIAEAALTGAQGRTPHRLCSVFATLPGTGGHFLARVGTPQTTTGGPRSVPEPPAMMTKDRD
jgi:hypothetical protein